MGLLDRFRRLVGQTGRTEETTASDPEDLLDISTAALRMETLGYDPLLEAGICFAADDAATTLTELRSVVESTTNRPVETRRDNHGFRWLVMSADSTETLASALQFAASSLFDSGYTDTLLAAVVGFQKDEKQAYWVYSFNRGRFYPFVPEGTDDRDTAEEFKLRGALDEELPIEDDESEWYPLWPDRARAHPWD